MTNIENRLYDIRHKLNVVKENIGNKYRHPKEIIIVLTMIEMELEDKLYFLKSKT